jgi:hypothetical protein
MRESTKHFPSLGEKLVGVEIGVWRGENALSILQNTDIHLLYLVDPYIRYDGYNINEISGHPNMDENEEHARKILEPYKDSIVWVKEKAHESSNIVPNDLDFVYIDGNHSKSSIQEDIKDWYPKVRLKGILAGHDFQKHEIRDTVVEFVKDDERLLLWSFPFEKPNHIHDWDEEWRVHKVPSDRISIDQEDWWIVKHG